MKKKGLLTAVISVSLILLLAMALPLAGGCAPKEKMYKIGLTAIVSHPVVEAVWSGFFETMTEEGFIEGENVEYDMKNPEGDMSIAKTIADNFVSERKDLIIAMTTPSSQAVYAAAEGTDIPVVFIAVTDPVLAGIVQSWENPCFPGIHITGVSDYVPVRPQLEIIKEICPDAKVVGAVYNPGDESNTRTVNELKSLLPEFGLELIEASISTSADIYTAAISLVDRVDVMWIPMDNTVIGAVEALISVCEEYNIPFFASEATCVEKGAIACVSSPIEDLGRLGAHIAARVLRGEDPCNIPVTTPETTHIHLNPGAAERIGATIPQSLLDKAYEIIEE